MPASGINFRVEANLDFPFKEEKKIRSWINIILKQEDKVPGKISFLFCDDDYLLQINRQFLKHDFYTDIITFDYSEEKKIEGEIFISVDRVKENAQTFKQDLQKELLRTIIHGILHLCGYKDKKPSDKKRMRTREDEALALI